MDRKVTIVVSDLHMGGGKNDPGDDFIFHKQQFATLIDEQTASEHGRKGQIELIINGDFLEFAQVNSEAYQLGSAKYWCSEQESTWKLASVISGHRDVFDAIKQFQSAGNQCTIFAGNHDVDFYWRDVQERVREAAGQQVGFELGLVWYSRYKGKLRISHGHMSDPANKFDNWKEPVRQGPHGIRRLEMCPGTLFMAKFVNWLEKHYPFADNLHPNWRLAPILLKEDRFGFIAAAWVLTRFLARHPGAALGAAEDHLATGERLVEAIKGNKEFRNAVTQLWREACDDPQATVETVSGRLNSEAAFEQFLEALLARIPPERWLSVFDLAKPSTLAIAKAGAWKGPVALRELAAQQWKKESAEIVVMGHTHEPDTIEDGKRRYYNPGSWTRYVRWEEDARLTLKDLLNESDFPYELNYVRVEASASGELSSQMLCYDRQPGTRKP